MTSNYNYAYFIQDTSRWDSVTEAFSGLHDICPFLTQFHISGITRWTSPPYLRQAGGGTQEAITRYGLSSAGIFTGGRGREKVWPGRGMGSPQPNSSSLSRGGGKETYFTYQHKGGLVLNPCASQWGCAAPPPFWCQIHQHPGRWSTQQKCLWASQPTGGSPTPSLGWGGDIPRGPEWRFRTSVGHSAEATTLGDGVH